MIILFTSACLYVVLPWKHMFCLPWFSWGPKMFKHDLETSAVFVFRWCVKFQFLSQRRYFPVPSFSLVRDWDLNFCPLILSKTQDTLSERRSQSSDLACIVNVTPCWSLPFQDAFFYLKCSRVEGGLKRSRFSTGSFLNCSLWCISQGFSHT